MLRNVSILLFVLLGQGMQAQYWNVICLNREYNFEINNSDFIESTIRVDSFHITSGDTIFYLNRIVEDCDTSSLKNGIAEQVKYDAGQFLQRQVRKTDSTFIFSSPEHYGISHKALVGDSWLFDTTNNITAQIIQSGPMVHDNTSDSIKIIALSTQDTIILSKSNGLIRFDPIYGDKRYDLMERRLPGFHDYFNFSPGDMFEFHGHHWNVEQPKRLYVLKAEVVGKYSSDSLVEYEMSVMYYERDCCIPEEFFYLPDFALSRRYNEKWVFTNSTLHPTNLYNKQLIRVDQYLEYPFCQDLYQYSMVHLGIDSTGLYTKRVGQMDTFDYFTMCDTLPGIMTRVFIECCDEREYGFTEGLGMTMEKVSGFEWGGSKRLVAYRKDNDTVGVFTDDRELVVYLDLHRSENLVVYPNPASTVLYIRGSDLSYVVNLSLTDLQGRMVKAFENCMEMNVSEMIPGIYILCIETSNGLIQRKVIINDP
ncbi:MAG: T9SS type A sorting domain-containing protein [Bacteroidota bacterium]